MHKGLYEKQIRGPTLDLITDFKLELKLLSKHIGVRNKYNAITFLVTYPSGYITNTIILFMFFQFEEVLIVA
jgi:hypothetical protein